MSFKSASFRLTASVFALCAFTSGTVRAQAAPANPPGSVDAHMAAAKQAAGFDYTGLLARLCIAPEGTGAAGPSGIPDRAEWYAEPANVFDNLYFVGSKVHSSWALTTSDGIILIDTLYNYAAEAEIVDGMKKLGLDPAKIKYVLISHGHSDHDEGAKLLQDRFGAHVVMAPEDWDMIDKQASMPGGKPKRDIVATDGQKITLGDTTVTIVRTPGHTAGTTSFLFSVKDGGKPLNVVYSGGTALGGYSNDAARLATYIDSQHKLAGLADRAGATILMTNHSEFDEAYTKTRLLAARKAGEAHPYEVGKDGVARYFKVSAECAEAALARLKRPGA